MFEEKRATIAEAQSASCIHHLFEAHADVRPDAPAIVSGDVTLSYRDVEERANRIARHLRSCGVKTGDRVGLFVERSPDAIVAILSILKAGAAYLPLDPSHPAERLRHIVEEAGVVTLVSESGLRGVAASLGGRSVVLLDDPEEPWQTQSAARLTSDETGVSGADLSYVLYTSGSTGRPKGVMTEHRNVVSFVAAFNERLRLTPQDRVFQGFALSFDGSVEETWMAFSNGGALVVPPRGSAKFGNDLAALLTSGGATVFSTVPTSLAMIDGSLPSVRLLIVSGERCSKEAVKRWATPGRRMLNVYGPTETTVNATAAECRPDRAVTIGTPLTGYRLHILDESGKPVGAGEKGELFIGGPGVARGYLNQPALTEKHFVTLGSERAYRTGDLVSFDDDGELLFHGRIDSQVKVRGFRIELSEIEAVLGEHDAVRMAAVAVVDREGASELAAYVVPEDAVNGVDRDALLGLLTSRLPAYMIPASLDVLDALPTLASGKVDRKRLPAPVAPLVRTDRVIVAPTTSMEAAMLPVVQRVFRRDVVSIDDHLFTTLGGYSLLAAQLVTELRKDLRVEVAIRDVYEHPTIAALSAELTSREASRRMSEPRVAERTSSRRVFNALSRSTWAACALGQALALYVVHGVMAAPYAGTVESFEAFRAGRISLASCAGTWILVWACTWPALLAISIAAKWLLVGRYKPGAYPLWGSYYFRFWLARRFQIISGANLLAGTPLMSLYLRAMGAKVGTGCVIDTASSAVFDLLTIGDDTSIGAETQLFGYRVEDGYLLIGSVDVGSRCFVGIHSALGLDVRMGDGARLDDLSLLPDGTSIPAGESRRGSPARPGDVSVPEAAPPSRRRPALFAFLHLVVVYLVGFALIPTVLPGWALIEWAYQSSSLLAHVAVIPIAGVATIVALCLWIVVLKRIVLFRVRPGVYPTESALYLRKWTVDLLMTISRALARPLYTTIYLPAWLRMLGARIGRRAEISTVSQFSPELAHIGEQSFFADGSMMGGRRVHCGYMELAESRVGRRSFVGNGAILPVGKSLGDNNLLGCVSAPPADVACTPDGTEWLGSPSFALPHRPKIGGFDESVTHEPTRKLIALRLIVDAMRIVIPSTLATGGLVALSTLIEVGHARLPRTEWLLTVPLSAMAVAAFGLACVVAVKKLLIGTFTPTVKPLWSMFVWLNEAVNGTYETVASPVLALLLGSPFCAPWLRLMGCKIGRYTYLETTLFSEFDLVHIGDHAALNAGAVIQNHLFEDRVMKASVLTIGDECTVGNLAVVLYDTQMQSGSSIGPLSLLMKGETLPPETRWAGIPTARAPRWVVATPSLRPSLEPEATLMEESL